MRSLFVKVFLWFWLTVVVAGVTLAMSVVQIENRLIMPFRYSGRGRVVLAEPRTAKVTVLTLPVVVSVVGGVFCFLITRHITSPVLRLRTAAASIAQGNLTARVTPQLGHRRDEIATLGRDFDRMAERLEALLAGQKRLLGDVSHELRSPLSRLTVALGLAQKGAPEEIPDHLDRIAIEAHRLDTLIGQLLTLSRMDSGMQATAGPPFDLTNLVHEITSDADFEARAKSCRVVVTSADVCFIAGSEELLRSAIENVVRNAVRFTAENTSVEISLLAEASRILLRVRDHGPGVPEDMVNQMFLPFRKGPGLGLAIAQRALALHGGTIRAMNTAGGGLIVEIELPRVA